MKAYSVDPERLMSLRIIVLTLAMFMVNNILGMLVLATYITINKSCDKREYITLFCFLSLFLGLINSGKMLESDLGGYFHQFNSCGFFSLWEYMSLKVKEPLFWFFTYIIYHLTAGNFSVYIIVCTFTIYFFLYYSIYKFFLFFNKRQLILYAVLAITLFTPYFSLTGHIIRQTISASLIIYYIVDYILYDKNPIVVLICALLIHSSAWFFVPLIFLKFFRKKITVGKLLIAIPAVVIIARLYIYIFKYLTMITAGVPTVSYVFSRLTREVKEQGAELGVVSLVFVLLLLSISVYVVYFKKDVDKRLIHFYNLFLALGFFVFLTQEQTLLSLRFYFYCYSFIPFVVFYPVNLKYKIYILPSLLLMMFLALKFLTYIDYGVWTYDTAGKIVSYSVIDLLAKF